MTASTSARTTFGSDVAFAAVYAALTQVELWVFRSDVSNGQQLAASVLIALMAVTLAFRSRAPVPAYFVNGVAVVVTSAVVGVPGDVYPFGNIVLLYTMATVASTGVAVLGLATGLAGVAVYFGSLSEEPVLGAFTMILWALAWAAGRASLTRRIQVAVEHERGLSLAAAEAQEARLALEAQRRRMTREIHDLVGHTLNVMVVHAGAGRRAVGTDPGGARGAGDHRTRRTDGAGGAR
ncbi:MAG TPA: histidine kinase dimerization/phosphoacceptor domain-containing protein [Euzebyales bacterium]|nr:histidine kinase dimerization/phosphoacceptor domain-containing protein [Euzebyales bacterium]